MKPGWRVMLIGPTRIPSSRWLHPERKTLVKARKMNDPALRRNAGPLVRPAPGEHHGFLDNQNKAGSGVGGRAEGANGSPERAELNARMTVFARRCRR